MTLASFNVSINNDNILEGNETFDLTIDPSLLPDSVTVGDPGHTTVTILANDGEYNCDFVGNRLATLKVKFNLCVASYKLPTYKQLLERNLFMYTINYIITMKLYRHTAYAA